LLLVKYLRIIKHFTSELYLLKPDYTTFICVVLKSINYKLNEDFNSCFGNILKSYRKIKFILSCLLSLLKADHHVPVNSLFFYNKYNGLQPSGSRAPKKLNYICFTRLWSLLARYWYKQPKVLFV
jgi:hypothetical protein